MAMPKDRPTEPINSFDITMVIDTVVITNGKGGPTPVEAAFMAIARHGGEGVYEFPNVEGGTTTVTVERFSGLSDDRR